MSTRKEKLKLIGLWAARIVLAILTFTMIIGAFVAMLLGVWTGDDRWRETGAIMFLPVVFFGALGFVSFVWESNDESENKEED